MEDQNQESERVDQPAAPRRVLVISASLNPSSRSYALAEAAVDALRRQGAEVSLVDLRKWELPICDGAGSFSDPNVEKLNQVIESAAAILLAAPVYNYDVNAAAKNLVELTGDAWAEKPVGFLCSAGGKASYMSPSGLASSLMFDFRSWIIPRFVYATRDDFNADRSVSPRIAERIALLAKAALDMARALEWVKNQGR